MSNAENTVIERQIRTVEDVNAAIENSLLNGSTGAQRGYSKRKGFNDITLLPESDTDTLTVMAGAVLYALATKYANGDESATDGINLISEYCDVAMGSAENLLATTRRQQDYNDRIATMLNASFQLGVCNDPAKMDNVQRLQVVRDFIERNNSLVSQADFVEWIDSSLAEAANAEAEPAEAA